MSSMPRMVRRGGEDGYEQEPVRRRGQTAASTQTGPRSSEGTASTAAGFARGGGPRTAKAAPPRQGPPPPHAAPRSTAVVAPAGRHTSLAQEIQNFALAWEPVVAILFFRCVIFLMWRTLKVMPRIKPQQIKPSSNRSVTFADIAGVDDAKAELQEIVEFLRDPQSFHALGAKVPKGMLLHGPPGTGKTLLAKAVANESGAQFFAQSAASFVEMFAGLGAARIRRLFAIARKHEPAIIFIDELDAVGGRRGLDISGEKDQTLNQLLVEMDGFASSGRVVVIAASNLLDKLDPALLRPGPLRPPGLRRAARRQGPPGGPAGPHPRQAARGRRPRARGPADQRPDGRRPREHLQRGGDLRGAPRRQRRSPERDFDAAIERVIAGVQSKRVLNEHEKRVVAYHEAGHALCGELLPSVDRVHRISIVPRGRALGYTLNLPAEDRYLKTREELIDYMTVLLGGRVAEQIVFGAITTGASDDLNRVADISHSMVHDYAMGTAGVGRSPDGDVRLSETTLRIRDEERQDLIEEARRGGPEADPRPPRPARRARRRAARAARCSSAPRSNGSWPACRAWSARPASACGSSPRPRPVPPAAAARPRSSCRSPRRRAGRTAIDCAACSAASTTSASPSRSSSRRWSSTATAFELALAHREVVTEQGVEAALLDLGENHVELLAPLSRRTRPSAGSSPAGPGPAPRRLPGRRHRGRARAARAGGPAS